jgi:hypothetical protein
MGATLCPGHLLRDRERLASSPGRNRSGFLAAWGQPHRCRTGQPGEDLRAVVRVKTRGADLMMTETVPPRVFDDMEALAWPRSQPDGRVTASAAELGRQGAGTGCGSVAG